MTFEMKRRRATRTLVKGFRLYHGTPFQFEGLPTMPAMFALTFESARFYAMAGLPVRFQQGGRVIVAETVRPLNVVTARSWADARDLLESRDLDYRSLADAARQHRLDGWALGNRQTLGAVTLFFPSSLRMVESRTL